MVAAPLHEQPERLGGGVVGHVDVVREAGRQASDEAILVVQGGERTRYTLVRRQAVAHQHAPNEHQARVRECQRRVWATSDMNDTMGSKCSHADRLGREEAARLGGVVSRMIEIARSGCAELTEQVRAPSIHGARGRAA